MKPGRYFLDTHALVLWNLAKHVSPEFIRFFDEQSQMGNVYVSSICFWEIALLVQKGRLALSNISKWKTELLNASSLILIDPSADDMIVSTQLPLHHKDPFDRLLVAQTCQHQGILVTQDAEIQKYSVKTFWI